MTSSKHTPGPWRFSPYYSFEKKRDVPNRYNGIYEPIPGQEFGSKSSILTVGIKGDIDDYWIHCSDANARLIEASPDLLEALKEINGIIEHAQQIVGATLPSDGMSEKDAIAELLLLLDGPDQRRIQGAARAAIAKAEGREG